MEKQGSEPNGRRERAKVGKETSKAFLVLGFFQRSLGPLGSAGVERFERCHVDLNINEKTNRVILDPSGIDHDIEVEYHE